MYLRAHATAARSGFAPELERATYVENLCVKKPEDDPIIDIQEELFFPIVIDRSANEGDKVWTSNSWNSAPVGSNLSFGVQLGILLAEDDSAGFTGIVPDREVSGKKYQRAVLDYTKHTMGRLSDKEQRRLRPLLRKTKIMDWRLYSDVDRMKKILNTKSLREDVDLSKVFPGPENGVAVADSLSRRLDIWRSALCENAQRESYHLFGNGIWFQHPIDGEDGHCSIEGLDVYRPVDIVPQDHVPVIARVVDPNGIGAVIDPAVLELPPPPAEVRPECPKIYVTLSSIPLDEEQIEQGFTDKKLYMLRLSVTDPTLDVRDWLSEMFRYVARQNSILSSASNNRRGDSFEPRFPAHAVVADADHPAYTLDHHRYIQCAAEFQNDASLLRGNGIITNKDIYRSDSPLNPINVFSFKNCQRILLKHGACDSSIGEFKDWLTPDGTVIFPSTITTFQYPPETVLWVHPDRLGLMEQMFPQQNGSTALYTAVFKGNNIEDVLESEIRRRRLLTGEHNPQDHLEPSTQPAPRPVAGQVDIDLEMAGRRMLYDEITAAEQEALGARIMYRLHIKNARLVNYETENRMVHYAFESDIVYGNMGKFYPHNAPDILTRSLPYIERHRNYWLSQLKKEDYTLYAEICKRQGTALDKNVEAWQHYVPDRKQRARMLAVFRKYRAHWKTYVLEDDKRLYADIERYERYVVLNQVVQDTCMERFSQLWRLDGLVETLPISDGCKAVLKYISKVLKSSGGIITRKLLRKDKSLTFFASSLTKLMVIFNRMARIVQPKVQILAEGLLSCYDWNPGEINFHILLHGRFDLGKTYQLLSTLLNFSSIPGRVEEETRATDAVSDSGTHKYDKTMAKDEIPQYYTSSKAQEANAERVNQLKQRMTRKQSFLTAFERKTMPDGSQKRGTQRYVTDDYSTMACVTNNEVEPTSALTSRFFCLVMKDVGVSVLTTMFKVHKGVKAASQEYVRLIEYHSAAGKKAAMCGAIMRDVNMDVWNDVSNQMIEYMIDNNMISKDKGYRSMQIMVPFLRQYVYHRAAILTWNIPGAPHYNEPYHVSQIQSMQQFLYVDLQTMLFVWTLLGSQYVNGDCAEVLGAAVRLSGISNWSDGVSPYDMYVNKRGARMPFRRTINPAYLEDQKRLQNTGINAVMGDQQEVIDKKDKYLLDLNYVTITGPSLHNIYQSIASSTQDSYQIAAIDVKGILETLSKTDPLQPPRNGYKPQPEGTFAKKHGKRRNADGTTWSKVSFPEIDKDGQPVDRVYVEDDVPPLKPLDTAITIPSVIIEKPVRVNGHWKVHIAPWAIERHREEIIVEAFNQVVMTPKHPRKKMLVGWTYPRAPGVFQVRNYSSPGTVDRLCQHYAGLEQRPPGYTRMEGVVFGRYAYNTSAEIIELDEQLEDRDFYQPDKPYDLIEDLEYYSALSQHVISGRPLDEPVQTPAVIEARYERACAESSLQSSVKHYSYPVNNLKDARKKTKSVNTHTGYGTGKKRKTTAKERAATRRLCISELSMEALLEEEEEEEEYGGNGKGKEEEDAGYEVIGGSILDEGDTYTGAVSSPVTKRARMVMSNKDSLRESTY